MIVLVTKDDLHGMANTRSETLLGSDKKSKIFFMNIRQKNFKYDGAREVEKTIINEKLCR